MICFYVAMAVSEGSSGLALAMGGDGWWTWMASNSAKYFRKSMMKLYCCGLVGGRMTKRAIMEPSSNKQTKQINKSAPCQCQNGHVASIDFYRYRAQVSLAWQLNFVKVHGMIMTRQCPARVSSRNWRGGGGQEKPKIFLGPKISNGMTPN